MGRTGSLYIYQLALFSILASGCSGGFGGCGGEGMAGLPEAGIPGGQTIEGGAQMAISESGFNKIVTSVEPLLDNALGSGFCIGSFGALGASVCGSNDGSCVAGCEVDFTTDDISIGLLPNNRVEVSVTIDGGTSAPVDAGILGSCTLDVSIDQASIVATIALSIDAGTGELVVGVDQIQDLEFDDIGVTGCGVIGDILDGLTGAVETIIESALGDFLLAVLSPALDAIIQSALPDPLGIEGSIAGTDIAGSRPEFSGNFELRAVPGGFVSTANNSLELGVITAFNSDADQETRSGAAASEAALCVPGYGAPDLTLAPYNLAAGVRSTMELAPVPAVLQNLGSNDIALGLSQSTLNLALHHVFAAGGLCAEVETAQLTVATLAPFLSSLWDVASPEGDDAILIVVRPTQPLVGLVGDGTAASPNITVKATDLEIDLYGYIMERYVRLLTLSADADVGITLTVNQGPNGPVLVPSLQGLDASDIQLDVINSAFLRETPEEIEALLPTVLNVALGALGDLGEFELPQFAGLSIDQITIDRVIQGTESFLRISGVLNNVPVTTLTSTTLPAVTETFVPDVNGLKVAMQTQEKIPFVQVTLPEGPNDWQWKTATSWPQAVPADGRLMGGELFLQGKHELWFRPVSLEAQTEWMGPVVVNLDSIAPVVEGAVLPVSNSVGMNMYDWVTRRENLQVQFAAVDGSRTTGFQEQTLFTPAVFAALGSPEVVRVTVMDEAGNTTTRDVATEEGVQETAGGCDSSGGSLWVLALLLGGLFLRRKNSLIALGFVGILGACGGGSTELNCEEEDKIETCANGECRCVVDVAVGDIGKYLSVAADDTNIIVAAYNSTHGDLMVAQSKGGKIPPEAWSFVDGVPDVTPDIPESTVRGGIRDKGDDVGFYSDVIQDSAGSTFIAHYDKTNKQLKVSSTSAPLDSEEVTWSHSVVDNNGTAVGFYPAFFVDGGALAIAYSAYLQNGTEVTSQLRVARQQGGTWTVAVLDSATVPADDFTADTSKVPLATGLFPSVVDVGGNQIAFCDRTTGEIKWVAASGGDVSSYASENCWGTHAAVIGGAMGIAYVERDVRGLYFLDVDNGVTELIDDGYRLERTNADGLEVPVIHSVGDDVVLYDNGGDAAAVYHDATSYEVRAAGRSGDSWSHTKVAGGDTPFAGAYGFYVDMALNRVATYVIDLPNETSWVEILDVPPVVD